MSALNKILGTLIGSSYEFSAEHQFFNATCIVTILATLLAVFIVIYGLILSVLALVFICVTFGIYLISRFRKKYNYRMFAFFIMLVLSFLSFTWFINSGTYGGVIYFYLATITFILFMTERWTKVLYIIILIMNVTGLFLAEHYSLFKIDQYQTPVQRRVDIYVDFIIVSLILAFVIGNIRRLYYQEKKNTILLIEEYRKNSENLKNELQNKLSILSIKEREIFSMIIEGKSNKEIADMLHVSLGTIKTHINNMYKKLGTSKRSEIMLIGGNDLSGSEIRN